DPGPARDGPGHGHEGPRHAQHLRGRRRVPLVRGGDEEQRPSRDGAVRRADGEALRRAADVPQPRPGEGGERLEAAEPLARLPRWTPTQLVAASTKSAPGSKVFAARSR